MPTCYQFGCSDILYLELLSEFPSIDYKMILPPEIPGVQASKNIWFVSAIRLLVCNSPVNLFVFESDQVYCARITKKYLQH